MSKVLQLILPQEDLRNPCLHALVSEMFAEMIIHNGICGKACESWLIWEGITKLICFFRPNLITQPEAGVPLNRLEQFGLLSSAEFSAGQNGRSTGRSIFDKTTAAFWSLLYGLMLAWLLTRTFFAALSQTSSLEPRASHSSKSDATGEKLLAEDYPNAYASPIGTQEEGAYMGLQTSKPVIRMRAWTCISHFILLPQRMPWLSGVLSLLQRLLLFGPGQLCSMDSAMDR